MEIQMISYDGDNIDNFVIELNNRLAFISSYVSELENTLLNENDFSIVKSESNNRNSTNKHLSAKYLRLGVIPMDKSKPLTLFVDRDDGKIKFKDINSNVFTLQQ